MMIVVATELLRVTRHGVAPLVILLVERGILPESVQKDVVEFFAIIVSFGLAYGWSWYNDKRRKDSAKLDSEQSGGPVGAGNSSCDGSSEGS